MASFEFTFPLGWERGCVFAEIDGMAEVDENEYLEIFVYDFENRVNVKADEAMTKSISLWLRAHTHYSRIIHECAKDECCGRVIYARELAKEA